MPRGWRPQNYSVVVQSDPKVIIGAIVCAMTRSTPAGRGTPRMRPTFEVPLAASGADVLARLNILLQSDATIVGQVLQDHAVLQLPAARRTMLSPFLNLEIAERESGQVLKGRFSPHPNVWTGFMAVYVFIGMAGVVSSWYGLAQWTLGKTPWMLLALPASIALIAFVYGAAVIGQGLTANEMYELRALVDRAVRESPPPAE